MANHHVSHKTNKKQLKRKDYTGYRFGRLVVVKEVEQYQYPSGGIHRQFLCKCDCGNFTKAVLKSLKSQKTRSCGCLRKQKRNKWNKNYINQKFGRLTITKEIKPRYDSSKIKHRRVECKCICGNVIQVDLKGVLSGNTKSCGCLCNEIRIATMTKHGKHKHPLYKVWLAMKDRCHNKRSHNSKNYYMKGIRVCNEWFNDFAVFYQWSIDNGYKKGLYIDRIDNDKGYYPENCRFVDSSFSARHTSLLKSNSTSGYRGVSIKRKKWVARIRFNNKSYYLGVFKDKQEAALAYDKKAKEFDAGHPLNFPDRKSLTT